jgi:predicted amidohydrolase
MMDRRQFVRRSVPLGLVLPACAFADKEPARGERSVAVAGVVTRWVRDGDYKAVNYERVSQLIRKAAGQGARIVCTTECFLDGYHVEVSDQKYEDVGQYLENVETGEYIGRLKALAKATSLYIAAGIAVADRSKPGANGKPSPFNACLLYSPLGELIGSYYKTHNFDRRSAWFAAVPDRQKKACFSTFSTRYGRIGCMVCNDRYFPETSRWLRDNRAQLILCPTGGAYQYDMLVARSHEAVAGIVWVHPCGFAATAPDGHILAENHFEGREKTISPSEVGGLTDHAEVFQVAMPIAG